MNRLLYYSFPMKRTLIKLIQEYSNQSHWARSETMALTPDSAGSERGGRKTAGGSDETAAARRLGVAISDS